MCSSLMVNKHSKYLSKSEFAQPFDRSTFNSYFAVHDIRTFINKRMWYMFCIVTCIIVQLKYFSHCHCQIHCSWVHLSIQACLVVHSCDDLVLLLNNKIQLQNFNPDERIDRWWSARRRRLSHFFVDLLTPCTIVSIDVCSNTRSAFWELICVPSRENVLSSLSFEAGRERRSLARINAWFEHSAELGA